MCLNSRMDSMQEILNHVPGDEFFVYKVLDKQGDRLRSPHYSHQDWSPGDVVADCRDRGNGDAGLYCFLVEPHPGLMLSPGGGHKHGGNRLVRLTAKKEDIVWGGHDSWNGKKGICLVLKKVHLTKEDHDRALSDQVQEYLVEEMRVQAKKDVEEVKEAVEKKREEAEELAKETERAVEEATETKEEVGKEVVAKAKKVRAKKPVKKPAKKPSGKSLVSKAKKGAKKSEKKAAKTPAKKSTKKAGEKIVSKAKKASAKKAAPKSSTSKMTAGKKLAERAKKQIRKSKFD